jgi:hypothetical protein
VALLEDAWLEKHSDATYVGTPFEETANRVLRGGWHHDWNGYYDDIKVAEIVILPD